MDLNALQRGDASAWDEAFQILWPVVLPVALGKLSPYLAGEAEDVAIEALEELVDQVKALKSSEELKPLAASIAHHRAVDRLRQHFAAKRGGGKVQPLEDAHQEASGGLPPLDTPVSVLERKELAQVLQALLAELKPPHGEILHDHFIGGLSYAEIAKKHGLSVGSVGVYLQRGLEAVRRGWQRQPK